MGDQSCSVSGFLTADIQVLWTAPPPTAGCVIFRATVLEAGSVVAQSLGYDRCFLCREVWSQDSERLTLELCEEAGEEEEDSPVQAQCCACEEAKYEVEFQGLWSKAADSNTITR